MPRILVITANSTLERLQLADEVRTIQAEIGVRSNFTVIHEFEARLANVIDRLQAERPAILHFAGHGDGDVGISLADDHHGSVPLPAASLAAILAAVDVVPKLIVLNCCYSAEQSKTLVNYADVVIGIKGKIGDGVARRFSADLYSFIGNSLSIKEAFDLACEVLSATGPDPKRTVIMDHRPGIDPGKIFFYGQPEIMARFDLDPAGKPIREGRSYKLQLFMRGVDEHVDCVTYQLCHSSFKQPHRQVHRSEDDDFWQELATFGDARVRATAWSRDNGVGVTTSICDALRRNYPESKDQAILDAIDDLEGH